MSKARVVVHEGLGADDARRAVLALMAMGLDAEARRQQPAPDARALSQQPAQALSWEVLVNEDDVPAALPVLADTFSPEEVAARLRPRKPPAPLFATAGIWTLHNAASCLAIAAFCIVVHLIVHAGSDNVARSRMIEAGAAAPWLIDTGQWWRLATAVFLHFDLKHLIGNMSALLFLGPPLAASIGQARLVVLFVATGVAGNLVSQILGNEAAVKAGASGGVCGLMGALGGVALMAMSAAEDASQRRPAWQTLGALVALFGMMVGFEPGRDHYAHVGGLLAGIVLGRLFGASTTETAT